MTGNKGSNGENERIPSAALFNITYIRFAIIYLTVNHSLVSCETNIITTTLLVLRWWMFLDQLVQHSRLCSTITYIE